MGLLDALGGIFKHNREGHEWKQAVTCPRCKAIIKEGEEKCWKCDGKVDDMFNFSCPQCKGQIGWNTKVCPHCGKNFTSEYMEYNCPHCGYKMKSMLTQCPVCGTRFV